MKTATMTTAVSDRTITEFRSLLISVDRSVDNAARIDLLRAREEPKASCAGAQALLTADLDVSTRKDRGERGVPTPHQAAESTPTLLSLDENQPGPALNI